MTEQVKVTQADREAEAWRLDECHRFNLARGVRGGLFDGSSGVQSHARHRIAAQAELLEALEDARHGLNAITVALAEQEFSTVAQKVGAYAERAGAALTKAKGEA